MVFDKWGLAFGLGVVSLSAGIAPIATACPTYDFLTRKDFAAADVVFEGTVTAIHPTIRKFTRNGKTREQITAFGITFTVDTLVRGAMDDRNIRVSWIHGTFGYPRSIAELQEQYGETLRVGLIMPEGMTDDCSQKMMTRKTQNEYKTEDLEIRCKSGYRAGNSPNARSGFPSNQAFIMNGVCTGPYMFDVTSRRDDPARDLSRTRIGDEGFQLENRKEIYEFTRTWIENNPGLAARYETEAGVRDSFMGELSAFANFDVSRLEPFRGLDMTEVEGLNLDAEGVEAYMFKRRSRSIFENRYEWYIDRQAEAQRHK